MANAANRASLKSEGGGDVFAPPADLDVLVIAEEDPGHPEHHEHMLRVIHDDPDNVNLLNSFRLFGWPKGLTISVWKDGDEWKVSNGKRRLTFVRIENERRKKERDERGPIRPRVVLDDDPLLTQTIANTGAKGDSPITLGRRFIALQKSIGTAKAAAALFLSVKDAQALAEIIKHPNADLHDAVNRKEIPIDLAQAAAKRGSATVAKMLEKAKSKDGKASPEAIKEARKEIRPRARTCPARMITGIAIAFEKTTTKAPQYTGEEVAAMCRWFAGDVTALVDAKFERVWRIVESGEAEMKAVRP